MPRGWGTGMTEGSGLSSLDASSRARGSSTPWANVYVCIGYVVTLVVEHGCLEVFGITFFLVIFHSEIEPLSPPLTKFSSSIQATRSIEPSSTCVFELPLLEPPPPPLSTNCDSSGTCLSLACDMDVRQSNTYLPVTSCLVSRSRAHASFFRKCSNIHNLILVSE